MEDENYTLRLYIAGLTIENQENIIAFKQLLKKKLGKHYTLEVIDIFINPELAEGDKIVATPTLLKKLPLPSHRVILDFREQEKLLVGMDLICDLGDDT